jgi:phosphate-selective porin OprO/OprP
VGEKKFKLTAGADYYSSEDRGTFNGRREGTSLDAQLVYGPSELHVEWLEGTRDPLAGATTTARGWAVLAAHRFTPKWQGITRYESYDSKATTANTTTDLWTVGLNYLLKGDDVKLSLNYLTGTPPTPAPKGDRLIGRLQVVF